MSKLVIQRKYGHESAGHETFEWKPRTAVKELEQVTNEECLSMAQAAFTEAMNETGAFAMMKMLPTDKEWIPTMAFNPDAAEIMIHQKVSGG
jgi:hypothetical protein